MALLGGLIYSSQEDRFTFSSCMTPFNFIFLLDVELILKHSQHLCRPTVDCKGNRLSLQIHMLFQGWVRDSGGQDTSKDLAYCPIGGHQDRSDNNGVKWLWVPNEHWAGERALRGRLEGRDGSGKGRDRLWGSGGG